MFKARNKDWYFVREFLAKVLVVALFAALLVVVPNSGDTVEAQDGGDATPVNVALGATASQSSTAFGGAAGRAVDGNTSGVYSEGSVTHTNPNTALQWWQLDLGDAIDIDDIVVWNRTNCCSERLADFTVFVSSTPFATNATIAELEADAAVESFSFAGVAGETEEFEIDTTGRYVRLQKPSGTALSLAEVQVFGTPADDGTPPVDPGTNVAPEGTASQSSTAFGGAAGRAIDGNTSGVYAEGSVTHTNPNTALQWWQLDLGEAVDIDDIVVWNRTNCCSERLADFTVFVSSTPFAADATIAELQEDLSVESFSFAGVAGESESFEIDTTGRYVRIQKPSGSALSLAEVQVFGTPVDDGTPPVDPGTNVAPDGTASQSSTAFGGAPGRAIDGNTSGVYAQSSVTHTNPNTALQWWELELAESTDIHSIAVWNRTDSCCTSRLANFNVFVSDQPFAADATIAELESNPEVDSFSFAGVAGETESFEINITGQYVRIQKPAGSALSLAEVQVFGSVTEDGPGITPADIGLQFNDEGQILVRGNGSLPTMIESPPILRDPVLQTLPVPALEDVEDVCSAGGTSLGFTWPRPPGTGDRVVYAKVTLPPDTELHGDVEGNIENGRRATGITGAVDGPGGRFSYIITGNGEEVESGRIASNIDSEPRTVLIDMSDNAQNFFDEDTTATAVLANLRFIDADGNETPACPFAEIDQCAANGGDLYLDVPIVANGQSLEGCATGNATGGCTGQAPFAFLQSTAVFACENDALLREVRQGLIFFVLAVGARNVTVATPAASPTGLRLGQFATGSGGSGLMPLGGALSIEMLFAGGAATVVSLSAYNAFNPGALNFPDIDFSAPTTTVSQYFNNSQQSAAEYYELSGVDVSTVTTVDQATGTSSVELPTVDDLIADVEMEARLDELLAGSTIVTPGNAQELRNQYRRYFEAALSACVGLFTSDVVELAVDGGGLTDTGKLIVALSDFNLPDLVTPESVTQWGFYVLDDVVSHVCNGVNVYLPGSVSSLTGNNWIVQATLHMSEALGTFDASAWPNPWTGGQPEPRPAWIFLNREADPTENPRAWLSALQPEACRGTVADNDQCDEWPWAATQQGGDNEVLNARPHVRIINAGHNGSSGTELRNFYSDNNVPIACNVDDGELFITLPLTSMFITPPVDAVDVDNLNFRQVESASICFGD